MRRWKWAARSRARSSPPWPRRAGGDPAGRRLIAGTDPPSSRCWARLAAARRRQEMHRVPRPRRAGSAFAPSCPDGGGPAPVAERFRQVPSTAGRGDVAWCAEAHPTLRPAVGCASAHRGFPPRHPRAAPRTREGPRPSGCRVRFQRTATTPRNPHPVPWERPAVRRTAPCAAIRAQPRKNAVRPQGARSAHAALPRKTPGRACTPGPCLRQRSAPQNGLSGK